jgi:HlyD family secretion protein
MAVRRILSWVVLIAAAVAAAVYAFRPQPVPVDLHAVQRGPLRVTVDGEGETRVREVYVVSAPVAGRKLRIGAHVGDPVVAGETVLATIEPSQPTFLDRRARLEAEAEVHAAEAAQALAQAEVDRVKAELDFARSNLRRSETLAAKGTISQTALERAQLESRTREAALSSARAELRVRRFELETARARLVDPATAGAGGDGAACCVEVRSPVDGTVLKVMQESEAVLEAGTPLIEVGDPADLEVVVDLLSSDAVRISEGADATVEEWGGGGTLAGRVRRVEPYGFTKVSALGIEEQRVNVILDFTDPPARWRRLGHGYRVQVAITEWHGADVLAIPLGSLFRHGPGHRRPRRRRAGGAVSRRSGGGRGRRGGPTRRLRVRREKSLAREPGVLFHGIGLESDPKGPAGSRTCPAAAAPACGLARQRDGVLNPSGHPALAIVDEGEQGVVLVRVGHEIR